MYMWASSSSVFHVHLSEPWTAPVRDEHFMAVDCFEVDGIENGAI